MINTIDRRVRWRDVTGEEVAIVFQDTYTEKELRFKYEIRRARGVEVLRGDRPTFDEACERAEELIREEHGDKMIVRTS